MVNKADIRSQETVVTGRDRNSDILRERNGRDHDGKIESIKGQLCL